MYKRQDLLIITDDGIMIRLPMEQVTTAGRATQGVRLIKVNEKDVYKRQQIVPFAINEIKPIAAFMIPLYPELRLKISFI